MYGLSLSLSQCVLPCVTWVLHSLRHQEIMTGTLPYSTLRNDFQVMLAILSVKPAYTLQRDRRDNDIDPAWWDLYLSCTNESPKKRPKMSFVKTTVDKIISRVYICSTSGTRPTDGETSSASATSGTTCNLKGPFWQSPSRAKQCTRNLGHAALPDTQRLQVHEDRSMEIERSADENLWEDNLAIPLTSVDIKPRKTRGPDVEYAFTGRPLLSTRRRSRDSTESVVTIESAGEDTRADELVPNLNSPTFPNAYDDRSVKFHGSSTSPSPVQSDFECMVSTSINFGNR